MKLTTLLQWHYLIFLLPFGVAALLLALSSVRGGGGRGGPGRHHHGARQQPHRSHSGAPRAVRGRAGGSGNAVATLVGALTGVGRAPLPLVLSAFFLAWGFAGYAANQSLLHDVSDPSPGRVLPSVLIALAAGLIGGRIAAEIVARLIPSEESAVVSRDALYGLTGRVTFPVTPTGGRIRVYDEHGTLHDESCRVAETDAPLAKGSAVLVIDRDARGCLIVEELQA